MINTSRQRLKKPNVPESKEKGGCLRAQGTAEFIRSLGHNSRAHIKVKDGGSVGGLSWECKECDIAFIWDKCFVQEVLGYISMVPVSTGKRRIREFSAKLCPIFHTGIKRSRHTENGVSSTLNAVGVSQEGHQSSHESFTCLQSFLVTLRWTLTPASSLFLLFLLSLLLKAL